MSDDACGRTLIVTGNSRGIGAAVARLAGSSGWSICLGYRRDADAAERVVSSLPRAIAVQADVAEEAEVLRLFERCDDRLGPPSALVSNAGSLGWQMTLADMSADRLARTLAVNVMGSMLCAREAVRRMATSRGGRGGAIVNVSSAAARLGSPNEYVDYAAAKGAIDTLTIGLAKEVAADGIRVNAVRPGIIDTDIHASGGEPDRVARLAASVPMQRGGDPAEVARAIMWLLSEDAS